MSDKSKWIWMGHAAHFICSRWCRFHMATCVGDWIVSTVGEYVPDSRVLKLLADTQGKPLTATGDNLEAQYIERFGYVEIGYKTTYETMVFKAAPSSNKCCPYQIDGYEVDFEGYNDADAATAGHYELCEKWSQIDYQTWAVQKLEAAEAVSENA